jgi:hypothetical protein
MRRGFDARRGRPSPQSCNSLHRVRSVQFDGYLEPLGSGLGGAPFYLGAPSARTPEKRAAISSSRRKETAGLIFWSDPVRGDLFPPGSATPSPSEGNAAAKQDDWCRPPIARSPLPTACNSMNALAHDPTSTLLRPLNPPCDHESLGAFCRWSIATEKDNPTDQSTPERAPTRPAAVGVAVAKACGTATRWRLGQSWYRNGNGA